MEMPAASTAPANVRAEVDPALSPKAKLRCEVTSEVMVHAGAVGAPIELRELDRIVVPKMIIHALFFFRIGVDFAAVERALATVLAAVPALAGRMKGFTLEPTDAGVPLLRATSAATSHDFHRGALLLARDRLDKRCPYVSRPLDPGQIAKGTAPCLSLQVTDFRGGGQCLAVSGWHAVFDGASFYRGLCHSLARAARGEPVAIMMPPPAAAPAPVPTMPAKCEFRRCKPRQTLVNILGVVLSALRKGRATSIVHFDPRELEAMKRRCTTEGGPAVSTLDSLLAHMWKLLHAPPYRGAVAKARLPTQCSMAVDFRARLDSKIPGGCVGNYWLNSFTDEVRVCDQSVAELARLIHAAKTKMTNDYVLQNLAFIAKDGESQSPANLPIEDVTIGPLTPKGKPIQFCGKQALLATADHRFDLYQGMDMGAGMPHWVEEWMEICPRPGTGLNGIGEGALFVTEAPADEGGLDVRATLATRQQPHFQAELEKLRGTLV